MAPSATVDDHKSLPSVMRVWCVLFDAGVRYECWVWCNPQVAVRPVVLIFVS